MLTIRQHLYVLSVKQLATICVTNNSSHKGLLTLADHGNLYECVNIGILKKNL